MALSQDTDLDTLLCTIYTLTDDIIKQMVESFSFALDRPRDGVPPQKRYNLSVAELVSLAIFRYFLGYDEWKAYHRHIKEYHHRDFPKLPTYENFVRAMNALAPLAYILLQGCTQLFKSVTTKERLKFADSSKLKVCENKREFTHKVAKRIAQKGKSSMGWFYGFKLHIICNEWMQILGMTLTSGNVDDRKALSLMWDDIIGTIVADAGYVGANWQESARQQNKILFTAVRANMKKLMTSFEHQMLKLRQRVESVFSVLKLRMKMETTLPRSVNGYLAHYLWCLLAYQMNHFFKLIQKHPLTKS